jgi:hypothetical protein
MIIYTAALHEEAAVPIKRWTPPREISRQETAILKPCRKRRKLFAFLREHRHEIFDDACQKELEGMYRDTGAGKEAIYPAMMAMALILQGYFGLSDADAVDFSYLELRWQMVLGRLGETEPAFSQGALFEFRQRLIEHDMDRRLLERTAAIARTSKGFDPKKLPKDLRIAVDSSPLAGAGRVEDTINLIGHAARKVVTCVATLLDWEYERVCQEAGIPVLLHKSIKRALDRDWSDPRDKAEAVDDLARQVLALERWIEQRLPDEAGRPPLSRLRATLHKIMDQDLEPDPGPGGKRARIVEGVAEDRQISIEDSDMRHGRKSKSKRIDGYKRHVATDLDSQAIVACSVTPANRPEHEALPELVDDLDEQEIRVAEAHFDRGYMASPAVAELQANGAEILCKPWKTGHGNLFTKDDFDLDLRSKTITCPAGHTEPIEFAQTVTFPSEVCGACRLRGACTTARKGTGRSISIAKDERLQKKLREKVRTAAGREQFRERVPVEHRLAHISQRQGNTARYRGTRKNLFDLRRAASIQNLETAQRLAS